MYPDRPGDPQKLGAFTCNICGASNASSARDLDREAASCSGCQSSIRFRSIILALSRALFGLDLALPEFPVLKSIRGMGISDSDIYSAGLESKFSYINTFYHREPRFDITRPDETEFGKYDFVICSDVLEHVPDSVAGAFATLGRLLKPTGILILTVPYSLDTGVAEHYSDVGEATLAEIGGKTILVARSANGEYRVFDELNFHGGPGATLERRIFSDESIRSGLAAAGFPIVKFDGAGNRDFGVEYLDPCSLPVIALRAPFALSASGVTELVEQWSSSCALLRAVGESRWIRWGRNMGIGPDVATPPKRDQ